MRVPDGGGTGARLAPSGEANLVFFAAIEMTRMPMIVTDPALPDNPVIFANQAFEDLSGYGRAEVTGRNCRFLQGPETDPQAIAALKDAIARRTDIALEILNYRKDGTPFWNALFVSPVFGADGRLLYFFGSQLDVSRQREAEEALRQAQKMEAVGQLTGGIAHDFNNMLTVMLGNLDGALSQAVDPRQRVKLERAIEAAHRAERLTRQLLAFARKQCLDSKLISLNELVENRRELLGRTLGAGIEIETRLAAGLWPARLDAVQAEAALLNVLLNARDAMPAGGRAVIATANRQVTQADAAALGGVRPGAYVQLTVSDTGAGIPPHLLARVMEPFFTTKAPRSGSGMGLAMVHGFMRQSQGQVTITSKLGAGTEVSLLFPAAGAAAADPAAAIPAAAAPAPVPTGSETILLVEDNPDVRDLADGILSDLGYRVLKAENGREALAVLDAGPAIDLLFTDLTMPGGMDGVALAREARRRAPRLRVLLATGYAERLAAGDLALIDKPYRRADLAGRIRSVLDEPAADP